MKIKRLILNVAMGNSHDGLTKIAGTFGYDVKKLTGQECLMFLNRRRDKMKILGAKGQVIGYLRMPKGHKIYMEAIQWLPETFHERGQFDYDAALKKALSIALEQGGRRGDASPSPLQVYRAAKAAGLAA
jgi:hypothetical protein